MSQNFDLDPCFYFMSKRETFYYLLQNVFLDFINRELGPRYNKSETRFSPYAFCL